VEEGIGLVQASLLAPYVGCLPVGTASVPAAAQQAETLSGAAQSLYRGQSTCQKDYSRSLYLM